MGARFDIRRYSAAEMVLLGIFAIGLLGASSLVRYRNKIRLSESVRLPFAGVSVSLPTGGGWQHWDQWKSNETEDVNVLGGHLVVGGKVDAVVQWRYMVVSECLMPEDRLSRRVGTDEVEIVDAGQIETDVAMDWVQARLRGRLEDVFLGMARVGQDAIVELEVITFGDAELAGRVFRAVAASLKFVEPDLTQRPVLSRLRLIGLSGDSNINYQAHPGTKTKKGWI